MRSMLTRTSVFGSDLNANPRLADLITDAKRAGFPKANIESAIARGQGRSLSGASLEVVTIEAILPNNIAVVIDCETDNKLRTLADVRLIIRTCGGNPTPTSYLFTKKGRIAFDKNDDVGVDEVFEPALEAGALDVAEDEDGRVIVFTEPNETKATGETLASSLGLEIASSDIVWDPNEDTKVPLEKESNAQDLSTFVDALQDKEASVQGVYMNVARGLIEEGAWADLQSRITA